MLPRNTPMVSKMSQTVWLVCCSQNHGWSTSFWKPENSDSLLSLPITADEFSDSVMIWKGVWSKGSKHYSREIVSLMPLCLFFILVFFSSHVQWEHVSVGFPNSTHIWEVSTSLFHLLALLLDLLVLSSVSWHLARRSPKDRFPHFPHAPWCLPSALQEWHGLHASYLMATVVSFTMS